MKETTRQYEGTNRFLAEERQQTNNKRNKQATKETTRYYEGKNGFLAAEHQQTTKDTYK